MKSNTAVKANSAAAEIAFDAKFHYISTQVIMHGATYHIIQQANIQTRSRHIGSAQHNPLVREGDDIIQQQRQCQCENELSFYLFVVDTDTVGHRSRSRWINPYLRFLRRNHIQ